MPKTDRQLLRQKIHQKISVIKTNTYDDLKEYLIWRVDKSLGKGNRSIKLQRETLMGDIRVFSKFDTWLVDKGYRLKKLGHLEKKLRDTLGKKEDTSRLFFHRDEYQKLLSVSKQRISQLLATT